ncbi:hypothetical protein AMECASPLE_000315, partial [Ameca splendens]
APPRDRCDPNPPLREGSTCRRIRKNIYKKEENTQHDMISSSSVYVLNSSALTHLPFGTSAEERNSSRNRPAQFGHCMDEFFQDDFSEQHHTRHQ